MPLSQLAEGWGVLWVLSWESEQLRRLGKKAHLKPALRSHTHPCKACQRRVKSRVKKYFLHTQTCVTHTINVPTALYTRKLLGGQSGAMNLPKNCVLVHSNCFQV